MKKFSALLLAIIFVSIPFLSGCKDNYPPEQEYKQEYSKISKVGEVPDVFKPIIEKKFIFRCYSI